MVDYILTYYDWIKALHIIAVISWMAGLLYLPRLFVYHGQLYENNPDSVPELLHNTFCTMERRLYKYIMQPAMHLSFLLGILMLFTPGMLAQGWMHAKLTCVFFLTVFHFFLNGVRKNFERRSVKYSSKTFRFLNEIPTLLMILIVILVVVKPF